MTSLGNATTRLGPPAPDTPLLGGNPVVDLVNTVHWRNSERRHDTLLSYADAVRFAGHVGLLTDATELNTLVELASTDVSRASEALEHLARAREAIHGVLAPIARDQDPAGSDLAWVGRAHADALDHARLVRQGDGFIWTWTGSDPWRRVARPLIAAATDLLLSPDRARIKECDDDGCGWLFVDHSKNGSRRWCSMDLCGSRAKMRTHYRRKKGSLERSDP